LADEDDLGGTTMREDDIKPSFCDAKHPVRYPARDFDYSGMSFQGRDLRFLTLQRVCFSHCTFVGALFEGADLEDADLNNCDLSGASLRNADLRGCNLEMSKTVGASFEGAVFDRDTRLPFSYSEALSRGMIYKISLKENLSHGQHIRSLRIIESNIQPNTLHSHLI